MFNQKSIAAFNNTAFNIPTIPAMSIHASAERLYAAALRLRDVRGQSAVARVLNVSPQVMKNWEARGVSEAGALKAQAILGCDANWILGTTGAMETTLYATPQPPQQAVVAEPSPIWHARRVEPFTRCTLEEWENLPPDVRKALEYSIEGMVIEHVRSKPKTATA